MLRKFVAMVSFCAALAVAGCSQPGGPVVVKPNEVAELAQSIMALAPHVDPEEARRAAEVAYTHSNELAILYEIEDPPLVHNTKVNFGEKPRGLCYHWADDIEKRLNQERFETLVVHRAVANAFNLRLEHSTAIISAKGESLHEGIVVDPWRKGGELFWDETLDDTRYKWVDRQEVWDERRRRREARGQS